MEKIAAPYPFFLHAYELNFKSQLFACNHNFRNFFFDTPQQLVAIQPQTESVTKIVRENKKKIGKKFKKQKVCYRKHFKVSSQGEKRVEELIPLNSD